MDGLLYAHSPCPIYCDCAHCRPGIKPLPQSQPLRFAQPSEGFCYLDLTSSGAPGHTPLGPDSSSHVQHMVT